MHYVLLLPTTVFLCTPPNMFFSRAINQEAMDYGINICVKVCTCEGEACGTGAPGAGDICNGVPLPTIVKPVKDWPM